MITHIYHTKYHFTFLISRQIWHNKVIKKHNPELGNIVVGHSTTESLTIDVF